MAVCSLPVNSFDQTTTPPQTFIELLQQRAQQLPKKKAYIFLENGETETHWLTYQALDERAREIAAHLQTLNMAGERVLLLYPSGLDFVSAFFGCLYAGVVAVPAYPPRRNQNLHRLNAIAEDSQSKVVLTTSVVLENMQQRSAENKALGDLCWAATDQKLSVSSSEWIKPRITSEDIAFLQYTSGSTGTPKGVMVSHYNLLDNEETIKQAFQHTKDAVVVGWLPLFHDMGLIGNLLQPLYLGVPSILMPPTSFLQKPIRWLQAISQYGATTSGGPNFAYDWCVKRIRPEQLAGLDLSQWKVAFNGAEPIRSETIDAFSTRLAPYGFRPNAFYPCYGMAETTLLVSGGDAKCLPTVRSVDKKALEKSHRAIAAENTSNRQDFIGCGKNRLEKIAIVHPDTQRRCVETKVGEIWVAGQSVTQGYWQKPELTQKTFQAYLADTGEGPFLRTGDLGFIYDNELFVTGRLKDVLIIRGCNYYPQDIEMTVQKSHVALEGCSGAAFTVPVKGEENLVVIQEVGRCYLRRLDIKTVVSDIREAITAQHQLKAHAITLVRPHSIPKTSSGKIQRYACRQSFIGSSLNTI